MSYFTYHTVQWVTRTVDEKHIELLRSMQRVTEITHWSRVFEYPWILTKGLFANKQWTLDAGGGSAPLQYFIASRGSQVLNVDMEKLPSAKGMVRIQGDLRELPFLDEIFDRVVCCSVLEHIEKPEEIIHELWRVLKPGGILVGSFDMASYYRWNHTIDEGVAKKLLSIFNCSLPPEPGNIATAKFPEIERADGDPLEVELKVLCFCFHKKTYEVSV